MIREARRNIKARDLGLDDSLGDLEVN